MQKFIGKQAHLSLPINVNQASLPLTVWQLPSKTKSQNMSYLIRTPHGQLMMVDGGNGGPDTRFLESFLARYGYYISLWWITHPHWDHMGTLTNVLEDPRTPIRVGRIVASLPSLAWIRKYEPQFYPAEAYEYAALARSHARILSPTLGWTTTIDGVRLEVLAISNPEIHVNALNNSSMVIRMSDDSKSILFLGDLGVEGGEKLLRGPFGNALHADYVQMAHHGQMGVGQDVYEAIRPIYCLWPTPLWLWQNLGVNGPGTGPFQTQQTRDWMTALNVRGNFPSFQGVLRIE